MSIDPIVLQTFIDAHSALADNIKQLPVQPHILSLNPLRRADFRNSINRASSQLEDLAVHLGSAGALLANDIKRSRDQLRLCIAPIGYLPAEVFRSIIRLLISSQPASQRPQAVRTLLAVSVRWRDIVQSDAFLFTFIDWNKWNAKIIAIWRARAGKYPLSITLDGRWVPLFTTSWPLRGGGHSLALFLDLVGSDQRVDAAQLAQSTLLDELAAALGKSCKALCLEWDHASAFYGFESWVKQRDIVLYDVEALASKVPEILHSSFQVKRLPSLRRLGAVHPISFSRGSPAHLTQLSLTIDRGKWSSYATSISRLPSLELLRIRLGQNSLQLDSWPQIILFQLNTFELCDCWSGEFMKNVIPSFNTPNVYELVLDSNQYLNRAWWRIWIKTFSNVKRLILSDRASDKRPVSGGIQSIAPLERLFRIVRFPALLEIHVTAEFGLGQLVRLAATLLNSYPKPIGNEHHQVKRLSLPALTYDSFSWFNERIEQLRSPVRAWDMWCDSQDRDPYDPDCISEWINHALRNHKYDIELFQSFDAGGYIHGLKSWLFLSESVKEAQVIEPDINHDKLWAANFRLTNELARSAGIAASRKIIQDAYDTLQEGVVDSGFWARVVEIRQLQYDLFSTIDSSDTESSWRSENEFELQ